MNALMEKMSYSTKEEPTVEQASRHSTSGTNHEDSKMGDARELSNRHLIGPLTKGPSTDGISPLSTDTYSCSAPP